jgi:hypothetical protein
MKLFVFKNGQQLGPFDETAVTSSLRSGQFSGEDLGIREGDSQWQPLSVLFPLAEPARHAGFASPAAPARPSETSPVSAPAPLYRKTTIHKVFFGLAFLGALAATIGAAAYWKLVLGPSGDLMTDLGNAAFRDLAVYSAIAFFGMTVLTFLALLLSFKRKIIRTSGLRMVLRIFFVFTILIGLIDIGYGIFSYLNWSPTISSSMSKNSGRNEMLDALESGEKIAGPLLGPGIHFPIGIGFVLLGLSGFAMTKSTGTPKD